MLTILIVDDEAEIVDMIEGMLRKEWGTTHTILSTNISRVARDIVQTQAVDILLTDIRMPGIDGFELSAEAKKSNEHCHVIFLTGYNDFDYAYRALKSGCDDFILKVNTDEEILRSLQNTIQAIEREKAQNELFVQAEKKRRFQKEPNGETDCIAFVKRYIEQNFSHEITLYDLSKVVYLNASYLSRLFKQVTGDTITEYLLQVRMEKAKQLLIQTDLLVQDIALKIGIDSPAYFTRVFKREVGCTAQEFRLQYLYENEIRK